VTSYGQFCPVALALEVFGERWTLLVIRELMCGSRRFSEIQRGVPLCSRSVLASRLRSLVDNGVIAKVAGGYELTEAGEELAPLVMACGEWGKRWAFRKLRNADVDVGLLMWDLRRRIENEALPKDQVWIQFDFRSVKRGSRRYWLRLEHDQEADLCLTHPGRDIELKVKTTPAVMSEVWTGERSMPEVLRSGDLELEGPKKLVRAFPKWLQRSVFATVERVR
jgi:DNA-binding HxlR family transcriptional regulator